jgi:hypothetical protein
MNVFAIRGSIVCSVFAWLLAAGCADGSSQQAGFESVEWPTAAEGIERVFAELPQRVGGLARTSPESPDPFSTSYGTLGSGASIEVWATDLGGAECPGMGPEGMLRSVFEGQARGPTSTTSAVTAEGVTSLQGSSGTRSERRWLALWVPPACSWVYVVRATDREGRAAGVEAMIRTAESL